MFHMKFATVLVALCIVTLSTSFSPVRFRASRGVKCITSLQCEAEAGPAADGGASTGGGAPATKGFGKAKAKVEKESDEFTDNAGTRTYATQQKRGVPEYNIFLRPAGGGDEEWVPVGSMTIPRDTSVPKAVFEVEGELLKGTYKLYPKLKAYSDVRSEDQRKTMFEYGYVLKAFPDEQIIVMTRPGEDGEETKKEGNFFTNWIDSVTSPIDSSDLKNKGEMTLNQNK